MGKGVVKLGEGNWAVKDGNLLAAKETNGRFKNAEFTVTRGTRATYVGRDGLIKESNLQDTNLVQNGDFSELGSELVPSIITTEDNNGGVINYISSNIYSSTSDGTSTSSIRPKFDFNTTNGKTYKLVITPTGAITGTINFDFHDGSSYLFQNYDFTTTKEIYFTDNGGVFGAFDGQQTYSIDSFTISVKQVDPNDRWSFSNAGGTHGWRIADGKAICDTNADTKNRNLTSSLSLDGSKDYKLTLDILQSADNITVYVGGTALSTTLPTGENLGYEYYISSADHSGGALMFYAGSSDLQEIDNVSVQEIKTDTPRIDFTDNTDGHLLLEPQSTNLVTYSEDFSQWAGLIELSIGLNQGISPNGSTEANLLSIGIDSSSTRHRLYNLFNFVTGDTYTYSIFAKKNENDWFQLMFSTSAFDAESYANFDLNNGVVGDKGTSTTANITYYGNGWYRCSITCTASASVTTTYEVLTTNNTNSGRYPSYQSSAAVNVCFLWGAQLEALSYPTSYIPTNGGQVTRDGETCTDAGEAIDFNSEEGVLYAEIAKVQDNPDNYRLISLNNAASNSDATSVTLGFESGGNDFYIRIKSGGVVKLLSYAQSATTNAFHKIAIRYKSGDSAFFINGTKLTSYNTGDGTATFTFPVALDNLSFDFNGNGTLPFYGKCKAIRVYKEALSDSELTTLTS